MSNACLVTAELLVVTAAVERVVELGLLAELVLVVCVFEALGLVALAVAALLAKLGRLVTLGTQKIEMLL